MQHYHNQTEERPTIMFSPTYRYQNPSSIKASSSLRKLVTQRALALIMFIGFALLGVVGGKEPTDKSPPEKRTNLNQDGSQDHNGCSGTTRTGQSNKSVLLTSWGSVVAIAKNFEEAFNDPALIKYGNDQATEILDSPRISVVTGPTEQPARQDKLSTQTSQ
jgi:hypothetical protein